VSTKNLSRLSTVIFLGHFTYVIRHGTTKGCCYDEVKKIAKDAFSPSANRMKQYALHFSLNDRQLWSGRANRQMPSPPDDSLCRFRSSAVWRLLRGAWPICGRASSQIACKRRTRDTKSQRCSSSKSSARRDRQQHRSDAVESARRPEAS
jgi:hypothetical protein